MATGNPNFVVAPNAPKSTSSGIDLPVDVYMLLGGVAVVAVVFLVVVLVYWRRLRDDAEPEFE